MKTSYKNSFTYEVEKKIEAMPYSVVLRADVSSLGEKRQITYALSNLIKQKKIARIGYGTYVKTKSSQYDPNRIMIRGIPGFDSMAREMLNRLNIPWEQSEAEEAYNTGKSTQIPVRSILRIKKRFRRKIAFKNMVFQYKQVS